MFPTGAGVDLATLDLLDLVIALGVGATEGEGVEIERVITRSIPVKTYLGPRIDRAINFVFLFVDLLTESIANYTQPKIVKGEMQGPGSNIDIELTVEPGYGLTGFKIPPSPDLINSTNP